jgi:molybdenum cofactor guanylyltransferase
MGRDKALLPFAGRTLLECIADVVTEGCGNVTIVGPDRDLGHRHIPDLIADCGPLGGLWTALNDSLRQRCSADCALLVACDMPNLTADVLTGLLATLRHGDADAAVCVSDGRLHPLCAVYHCRLLPKVQADLHNRQLKMHHFLSTIHVSRYPVADPLLLRNLNTPEDYALECAL